MGNFRRGVLLFLVLVLVLSSGITYFALQQVSKNTKNRDNQKMTVALVNEDQGAKFNGEHYEFGREFAKGIEKTVNMTGEQNTGQLNETAPDLAEEKVGNCERYGGQRDRRNRK